MNTKDILIDRIPSILWGKPSSKMMIAVHGNQSNKQDLIIEKLAIVAISKGYQLLSFDLPQHGDRKNNGELMTFQNCSNNLLAIMDFAKNNSDTISCFGCSIGAYFIISTFPKERLHEIFFLSPLIYMNEFIENMMTYSSVSKEELKRENVINTDVGQLVWDDYQFTKNHPLIWDKPVSILVGQNDELSLSNQFKNFVKMSKSNLTVLENGEHFFHTEEQISYYSRWLQQTMEG